MTLTLGLIGADCRRAEPAPAAEVRVALPSPRPNASGLDDVLRARRSVREFGPTALTPEEIGHLAWAAQGVTDEAHGLRTAPSAGALYPLELWVVAEDGVSRYDARAHALVRASGADRRAEVAHAALEQASVGGAPVLFVITGVVARTRVKYGPHAERFVWIEGGHAAQNLLLEATALGLGAVSVGAFDEDRMRAAVGFGREESPLYVIPVGHPR
jgi:SagB-type dehydrogenase family enzyme